MWDRIEPLLQDIKNPSQYVGGEINAQMKNHDAVDVRVCLAFPDVYAIGMGFLGYQIAYGELNTEKDILAERAFAPWPDMEKKMRAAHVPLFTVDSHTAVKDFDIIGFTLQHEMCYTGVLNCLDLAEISLKTVDRDIDDPLVIAGGPGAFAPEPLADFVDVFYIGESEGILADVCRRIVQLKKSVEDRRLLLHRIAKEFDFLYVPSLYKPEYYPDGSFRTLEPLYDDIPVHIKKAIAPSLAEAYHPAKPIIPFSDVVHDRINIEIMRGCPHKCRFCQSVVLKNRLRYRPVDQIAALAEENFKATGYDEIALTSLSSGDYPELKDLIITLTERFDPRGVSLSFPSLRVNRKIEDVFGMINEVRKSGFTIAPEAGTERMRKIIRKGISDEDLLHLAGRAFQEGWKHIKLYFMVGLPGEEEQDVIGIVDLADRVAQVGQSYFGRPAKVNVTISPFIPKPHTAFQWAAMKPFTWFEQINMKMKELIRKKKYLRFKFHLPERNYIEGAFARGDRRLGRVMEIAWRKGCRLDAWEEFFDYNVWIESFEEAEIDHTYYTLRAYDPTEAVPWQFIDAGISKQFLEKEHHRSEETAALPSDAVVISPESREWK